MNDASAKPPTWFWIMSILILLWGAMGVFAFYTDVTMSEEMLAAMDDYDRRMYLGRPAWFATVYGLATWGGFLGGVALLAVVMVGTIGRPRLVRRRLLCLPIGMFCGLVLSGAWMETDLFW